MLWIGIGLFLIVCLVAYFYPRKNDVDPTTHLVYGINSANNKKIMKGMKAVFHLYNHQRILGVIDYDKETQMFLFVPDEKDISTFFLSDIDVERNLRIINAEAFLKNLKN